MAAGVAEAEGGRVVSGQAAAVVAAVMGVFVAGALWSRRWAVREAARDALPIELRPDARRLLQVLDAHLNEYVAEDPDLWPVFGVGGNWDHSASHDTNQPEGDQQ